MSKVSEYFDNINTIKRKLDIRNESVKIIMREDGAVTIYDFYEGNWHLRIGFDTMSEYISWLEE